MITYNNIIGRFEKFVEDHFLLKTFTHGSPSGVDLEKLEVYPALHVVYTGSTYDNTSKEYSFEVYILDLPPDKAKKIENQTQLVSNAEQVAEDILADMRNGGHIFDFGHLYTVGNASTTPLEETTSNSLAGILLTISIEVGFTLDSCNAPLDGVTPSGSEFPAASPSGLRVKEEDGSPDVLGVTTIIVSDGTLTDDGLGVVTIDTSDKGVGVYLPLTGGTLTGDLNVDADLTVTGEITADSNFISSDSILVAATTGAGSILLRPNGKASNSGQVILDAAGKVTTSGEAQIGGELDMSTNNITNLLAGTTNLDAVNYQQLTDAITGVLVYKGTWDASTNDPALASGTGDVGSYYIVSVSGNTDLDGITDWVVGDWAVFSDLPTPTWQKIDNTSILGGVGTGGKISKWTGSGTSRTLGDSVITESSGGNVGVGATSPIADLQIGDGTTDPNLRVYYLDGAYTEMLGYGIKMSRANSYIRPTTDNVGTLYIGSAANTWKFLHFHAETTTFNTEANGESMRINSSGNVGIGTSSPASKLHTSSSVSELTTIGVQTTAGTVGNLVGIGFATSGSSGKYKSAIGHITTSSAHGVGAMVFCVDGAGDADPVEIGDEAMRITSAGNVGIGTDSPAVTLHVNGFARLNGGLQLDGNNRQVMAIDNTSLILGTNNTEKMRITSTGRVGVGITNPQGQLEVRGAVDGVTPALLVTDVTASLSYKKFIVGRTAGEGLYIGNDDAASIIASFQDEDSAGYGNLIIQADDDGSKDGYIDLRGKTGGSRMRVLADGNVGIGTTSPATKLHVNSGTTNIVALFESTDNKASIQIKDNDTIGFLSAENGVISVGSQAGAHPNNINIQTSTNNVGIGTTSPAVALDVNGGVRIGEDLGGELVSNGDFSATGTELAPPASDITQWSNSLLVTQSGTSFIISTGGYIFENIPLITSGTGKWVIEGSGDVKYRTNTTTSYVTVTLPATIYPAFGTPNTRIQLQNSSGSDVTIDNISVKELGEDWTLGTGWSIGEDKAVSDGTAGNYPLQQSIFSGSELGNYFKVQYEIISYTSGTLLLRATGFHGAVAIDNSVGVHTLYLEATSTSTDLVFITESSGFTGSISNISVEEVDAPSSTIEGTMRYSKDANNSYVDMCMQTGASTYAWVNIKTNTW